MRCAVSRTSPVSDEILQIRALIAENTNEDGLHLPADRAQILRNRLEIIHRSIVNLEREVAIHRIGENNHAAAGILEDAATEFLADVASEMDVAVDNLLFPDFGKGGRS
nr:hypothetical protein [uncultured Cohaesibacter sp.]